MVNSKIHDDFNICEDLLKDIDQLQTEPCRLLFDWWTRHSKDDIPSWENFDIIDFLTLTPKISLMIRQSADEFAYVIQGEDVLDIFDRQYWLRRSVKRDRGSPYDISLFNYFETICDERAPRCCRGKMDIVNRGYITMESIDLPFKDKAGNTTVLLSILSEI